MTDNKNRSLNPGMISESIPSPTNKFVIICVLVLAFILLSMYFHLDRHEGIGYSHFAYIPIIFAGFWWGRKAIYVAIILGMDVLGFSIFSNSASPLWADSIRVLSFLIVAFVIGELSNELLKTHRALREREDRVRKTNSSLREFAKLRKAFLHIAIHDMKSPVSATTMLLHSLQTLLDSSLTDEQEYLINRMHSRLDEATSFLHDFQLFAQLEDPSQIRKQATEINLNDLISDVVNVNQDIAHNKNQKLTCDLEENLSTAGGVERLIREVISNLVTNAIKYTPENGNIIVRSITMGDCVVSVEVEDDGIGISEKDQKKLFKEFVRIKDNNVAGQKVGGIGLGLSIVKRIINMHGGKAYVISEPGKGSTFGILLHSCPGDNGPLIRPALRVSEESVPVKGYIPE
ncbi:MAG: HAMP domain-containing histidine kinase [Candidatus Aegiribacteria sp.]|nr:HAMP domain-containing histidine kinase [Candidatus Aegiribacteria sp.]